MKIQVKTIGNFSKTKRSLFKKANLINAIDFETYAQQGLEALKNATPVDSGLTAESWYYIVEKNQNGVIIRWCNRNVVDGVNVAVLIQYGHASKDGDWIEGKDYINPAIIPVFKKIVDDIEEELHNA